jgi:eukaryotic-like serine/threonine-protein kinase
VYALGGEDLAQKDLWLFDFARGIQTRLTFDGKSAGNVAWSPDGRSLAFSAYDSGFLYQMYRMDAAGGDRQQLTFGAGHKYVTDWSPDGRFLLFTWHQDVSEIWALSVGTGGQGSAAKTFPVVQRVKAANGEARIGAFSPDGRWVAYVSAQSGRPEVYVQRFTETGSGSTGKWQVSSKGGFYPRWRADGKEIFFNQTDTALASAAVRVVNDEFASDAPREVFPVELMQNIGPWTSFSFDVSPDGQRFVVLTRSAPPATTGTVSRELNVVLNWQSKR